MTEELQRIRKAKGALQEKYGGRSWFRGAGIAPKEGGMALRLNVDPAQRAEAEDIPREFQGFEVEVVFIDAYKPRSSLEG